MLETFFLWLAAALGALTRLGDMQPAGISFVLALFAGGWLLGVVHPDGAWRRALALGLAVPLAHAIAALTHTALPNATPGFAVACLALVPSVLGSFAGVAARRAWGGAAGDARRG